MPDMVTALVTASLFIGAGGRYFLTGTSLHCWVGSRACFMPKGLLTFGRVSPTMRGALEIIDKNEEFIRMTLAVMMAPD
ncbi:hypothetical protein [Pseudomonas sp. BE134]|uniref:hypothetical protein n=1 Tax=Pseudomonas sp. BE134 TaxID=2817843 RepID=UPI00285AB880|nr:hypothetical protein [Pseudomonas sp. BE134]MDR6924807.1 hypothetical protein [Pseudomonas sp. BE134]